jgi:hypothetical protein
MNPEMATGPALFALEHAHLHRLSIFAVASVAVGGAVLAWYRLRRSPSAFAQHFGIQSLAWGIVNLAIVWWASRGLTERDVRGAVALDRVLWLNIGLDVGYAMVGATLVVCGWRLGRKLGLVGAGAAIIVQGVVLAALDAQLSAALVR